MSSFGQPAQSGSTAPVRSGGTIPPATSVSTGGWASLLEDEERHARRQGFGAGVIVISFAPELLRRVDDDSRALVESAIITLIQSKMYWTDRGISMAPGRFGIVTVPIDGTLALAARARALHEDLRGRGLMVDIAYALRRDRGGLTAAAARADAALDTAAARRCSPIADRTR